MLPVEGRLLVAWPPIWTMVTRTFKLSFLGFDCSCEAAPCVRTSRGRDPKDPCKRTVDQILSCSHVQYSPSHALQPYSNMPPIRAPIQALKPSEVSASSCWPTPTSEPKAKDELHSFAPSTASGDNQSLSLICSGRGETSCVTRN